MASPMKQFEVKPVFCTADPCQPLFSLGGQDIYFTNAALWMLIAAAGAIALFVFPVRANGVVPGRTQSVAEMLYEFVNGIVRNTLGDAGKPFLPLVFTLFVFILFCNMFGMLPYSFTVTSHIVVTFAMAMTVFLLVILVGLWKHGIGFLRLFVPSGVPIWLMPIIVPIEIISFFTRPISLSVRLFANMLAGHTMLKVFATFVVGLLTAGGLLAPEAGAAAVQPNYLLAPLAIAPLLAAVAVTALEFLVAFLQAYVFAMLTCIYLNDAVHLHDHH